jgi:hypothetical protein
MATLPDRGRQAWEERDGPVILATVDAEGVPTAEMMRQIIQPILELSAVH